MNAEIWPVLAIIGSVFGTGIALAAVIVPAQNAMRRDISQLRERMAKLEGLFEGFAKRGGAPES